MNILAQEPSSVVPYWRRLSSRNVYIY